MRMASAVALAVGRNVGDVWPRLRGADFGAAERVLLPQRYVAMDADERVLRQVGSSPRRSTGSSRSRGWATRRRRRSSGTTARGSMRCAGA